MKKKKVGAATPRKGSLASFEEHFKAAFACCVRNGAEHPFAVALLMANSATKAERPKAARSAPKSKKSPAIPKATE